ncbi:MAG: GspE/PulE/PilB domain-containing protein [Myxococcaceae bacterium]
MTKKIGELLVEAGSTTAEEVNAALAAQRANGAGGRLGELLVARGKLTRGALAKALAAQFELPFVEVPEVGPEVARLVPTDFQVRHRVVVFRADTDGKAKRLHLAVEDPSNLAAVDELRFELRSTVVLYVAAADDIDRALEALRGDGLELIEPLAIDEEPPEPAKASGASGLPYEWAEPPAPASQVELPLEALFGEQAPLPEPHRVAVVRFGGAAAKVPTPPPLGPAGSQAAGAPAVPVVSPVPVISPVTSAPRPAAAEGAGLKAAAPQAPAPRPAAAPARAANGAGQKAAPTAGQPKSAAPEAVAHLAAAPDDPLQVASWPAALESTPPATSPEAEGSSDVDLSDDGPTGDDALDLDLSVEEAEAPPPRKEEPPAQFTGAAAPLEVTSARDIVAAADALEARLIPPKPAGSVTQVIGPRAAPAVTVAGPPQVHLVVTVPGGPTPGPGRFSDLRTPLPGSLDDLRTPIPGAAALDDLRTPIPGAFDGLRTPIPGGSPAPRASPGDGLRTPLPVVGAGLVFSEEDLKILDSLEQIAAGSEPLDVSEKVKPARMVASLIRLLIKKNVINELEFLDELTRK